MGTYLANLFPMRSFADLSEINGEGLEKPPVLLSSDSRIGVAILVVMDVPPILIIRGLAPTAFFAASLVFRVSTEPWRRILLRLTRMAESTPPDLGEATIILLLS